jgi:sugar phosphate isomerase/epimerase
MLYGGPASSPEEIAALRALGFDFAEVVIPGAMARRLWWESGVKNESSDGCRLIAHGPTVEEPPDDLVYLRNKYLPALMATVDTAYRMQIKLLTVHLWMDARFIPPLVLADKRKALKELIEYGLRNGVAVCLENVSETAADLEIVVEEIPNLQLTLDIGHAQLMASENASFEIVRRFGKLIRHLHVHDNMGGDTFADDLHLPIGDGSIDFPAILKGLIRSGYDGTMTLELKPKALLSSFKGLRRLVSQIQEEITR